MRRRGCGWISVKAQRAENIFHMQIYRVGPTSHTIISVSLCQSVCVALSLSLAPPLLLTHTLSVDYTQTHKHTNALSSTHTAPASEREINTHAYRERERETRRPAHTYRGISEVRMVPPIVNEDERLCAPRN